MADKVLSYTLAVLALVLGLVVGHFLFPVTKEVTVTKEVPITVTKEVPTEVVKEVVKEVPVDYRAQAWATIVDRIGDKDSFLTCGDNTYDSDEYLVTKVYDDWKYILIDAKDGKYSVTATWRLKFSDGSDNSPCRDTRTYTVTYEDGEKPKIVQA
jgi:hypothetical protein